ncbi:MAG TPA: GNAT family N-acetyltransferase [Steroidobacteraceae bacterium]
MDALIRLNAQVQRLHAQVHPADFKSLTDEAEVRDFLASVMRRTDHTILVAQVNGAVVGYAWFEIQGRPQTPFTWPKKRVFLHQICVDSGHQRLGVGSALMNRMEERARAGGIGEIALDMWSLNDTAQAFFKSCGLETYRLFLRKQTAPRRKVQGEDLGKSDPDLPKGTRSMIGMQSVEFDSPTTGMKALVYSAPPNIEDNRVILYLHGSGGFGTDLAGLCQFPDLPRLLRDGMSLTSTVLIPSCHEGEYWQPEIIGAFLDDYEHCNGSTGVKYDVIGYSRGGTGALYFAASAPERVRTIVAISARSAFNVIPKITVIPTLFVHGTKDARVPADESRQMHQGLCAAGGKCELMLLDGDHFVVADGLAFKSIFDWQHAAVSPGISSTS